MTISGQKEEIRKSNADQCAKCWKGIMANSGWRSKCDKLVHDRCAKMKRVTSTQAKGFISERCVEENKGTVEPAEEPTFFD